MHSLLTRFAIVVFVMAGSANAQQAEPEEIPFAGGELTITENEDLEKILAYNGEELTRHYVVFYDRTVEVAGLLVALFAVGDGGNACGTAKVIVWKPEGEEIKHDIVGEDCGAPPAAISGEQIYFVPLLMPGEVAPVEVWSPTGRVKVAGMISFAAQSGTGWADLDPASFENIIDAMDNEAVYEAAKALLGDDLTGVTTGLLVGGGYETTAPGVIYSSGCVPHACGSADAFMAVDQGKRKLYFAQEGETPKPKTWPKLREWPTDVIEAMEKSLADPE